MPDTPHDMVERQGQSVWPSANTLPPPPKPSKPSRARVVVALLGLLAGISLIAVRATAEDSSTSDGHRANAAAKNKRSVDGHLIVWKRESVTITLDPSLEQAGPGGIEAVRAGFGAWLSTSAHLPAIRFEVATTPGAAVHDGVNRVVFGPIDIPGHKDDLSITITDIMESTGEIQEVDVILNSARGFGVLQHPSNCGASQFDLQDIAAHEAGHFFGLGEDTDNQVATMFFQSSPCETMKRDLEPSDADALVAQYEGADEVTAPLLNCSTSSRPTGFSPVLLLGLAGLIRRRR